MLPGFPPSFQPVDFDFLIKRLKFGVAGDEFSLLFSGPRGGEGIGQTQPETGNYIDPPLGSFALRRIRRLRMTS